MHSIRPREHAARIADLKTVEERRNALDLLPAEYLEMVKDHLRMIFIFRKLGRK